VSVEPPVEAFAVAVDLGLDLLDLTAALAGFVAGLIAGLIAGLAGGLAAALAGLAAAALESVRVASGLGDAAFGVVGSSVGWRSAIGGSSGSADRLAAMGAARRVSTSLRPVRLERDCGLGCDARNRRLLYPAPSVAPTVRVSGSGRDTRTRGIDRWVVR
jgi:hypothetical protein